MFNKLENDILSEKPMKNIKASLRKLTTLSKKSE